MPRKRPDNRRPLLYVLLKKYGVRGALDILRDDVFFDLRHRVNTAAPVSQSRLYPGQDHREQNRYVASTFAVMRSVLNYATARHDLTQCGFLDLGSGKGKALISATRYPFQTIRGVDVSPLMHVVATENLKRLKLSHRVELIHASASDIEPQSHERIIYLFNPFTGAILEKCLDQIRDTERDGPGLLIYVNPTEITSFESRFELLETVFLDPGDCEVSYFALP